MRNKHHDLFNHSQSSSNGTNIASLNFKKRFGAQRKALQLSQRDLADKVDVSVNTIQSYEAGSLPRGPHFLALAKALKCSINWLVGMNENGDCLPVSEDVLCGSINASDESYLTNNQAVMRPQWLSPPHTENISPKDELVFPRAWLASIASAPENVRLMELSGSSMTPALERGDKVLVDIGCRVIQQGCLYCLKIDGHYSINRLETRPGKMIRVTSDNYARSPAFKVMADDLEIVGRVIWAGRLL